MAETGRLAVLIADRRIRFGYLSSLLGRLPLAVEPLGLILLGESTFDSYPIAAAVTGVYGVAEAVAVPRLGRMVDRFGARRTLVLSACLHAVGLALVLVGAAISSVALTVLAAVVAGLTMPPISPALRSLWPHLLGSDERALRSALTLDAMAVELVFILGPLIVALVYGTLGSTAVLGFSATVAVLGAGGLARISHRDTGTPPLVSSDRPSRVAGMRTMMAASLPAGICLGAVQVGLVAGGESLGASGSGVLAVAMVGVGSIVGGVAFAVVGVKRPAHAYIALLATLPITAVVPAVAGSPVALVLTAPLTGAALAPLTALEGELTGLIVPQRVLAEAYGWITMSIALGGATGIALGGLVIDAFGWRESFAMAAAFAVLAAVVAFLRRGTLAQERTGRTATSCVRRQASLALDGEGRAR